MAKRSGLRSATASRLLLLFVGAGCSLTAATHTVVNETNYHTFSTEHPVLVRVRSGDRVVTKTVDSAGFDLKGVRHTKTHGNPLTGPFYIEGAEPGDVRAIDDPRLFAEVEASVVRLVERFALGAHADPPL